MKTISGSVVSSKPVSLSKAASIMNTFISVDTGAPGALSVYLRRTTDAFNELLQFHSNLKAERSDRKRKTGPLETLENVNLIDTEENHREHKFAEDEELGIESEGRKIETTKKKKKKNKMKSEYDHEVEERVSARDEVEKSKERKKRKKEEAEDGGFDNSEERHRKKKKKKKRKHEIEN
ncbi:hypothetical protein BVC80_1835g641 [Macleaya cordata]|uniref:Uncharacterized protein n=1 Tax=Macleaya cordata TaxID=56857 RepID=A0A200R643_MACCD|nr:hypothetical protein BVC80_1835g641 [Macleaya cordata]